MRGVGIGAADSEVKEFDEFRVGYEGKGGVIMDSGRVSEALWVWGSGVW